MYSLLMTYTVICCSVKHRWVYVLESEHCALWIMIINDDLFPPLNLAWLICSLTQCPCQSMYTRKVAPELTPYLKNKTLISFPLAAKDNDKEMQLWWIACSCEKHAGQLENRHHFAWKMLDFYACELIKPHSSVYHACKLDFEMYQKTIITHSVALV